MNKSMLLVCATILAALPCIGTAQSTVYKKRVENIDDLPRTSYQVQSTVTELIMSDELFTPFAAEVKTDIVTILDEYDIADKTTLRNFYSTLFDLAMLDGEYNEALELIEQIRALQDKPASKYMTGLVSGSIIRARQEAGVGDSSAYSEAFSRALSEGVAQLPWEVVQENIEQVKGMAEIYTENLFLGAIQSQLEPVVEQSGQLSSDRASRVIALRYMMQFQMPLKNEIVAVLTQYIDQNRVEKQNIWQGRDVVLDAEKTTPVIIAVWDTGVDVDVFPDNLWVNSAEQINGKDDDGNGFIDDVHGIAYNLDYEKTPALLYQVENADEMLPLLKDMMKGFLDLQAAIDSPEASALRQKMATMEPEEVAPLMENLMQFALYMHGTHVAGIAAHGNPAARIMAVRFEVDYHAIPPAPTIEEAHRAAQMYREIVDYYKTHGVRVVNMSWIGTIRETEHALEANGIGETPQERAQLAREIYDITKETMYGLIKNTPEILYVNGAGNANDDVSFEDYYPTSFDLPNILVAGAVDQAGDETSFTSFGDRVDVYTNGFEVESYLPGGETMAGSGTSMASPQASNLAAKLFALEPSLTPAEVVDLVKKGADTNPDGRFLLMNPKQTVVLLEKYKKK